ncbi:NUDIX hydrolase N-terminal domain-containing protein [Virgibacillus sp. Bac330]|uniref:NUDIX hydrolase N-terminal domain-containing protein n=1 Tax=Virgibacillus sp. Bac330 TaxID=2419841 RepID=UPI000EF4CCF4|nr:NUDIX hydrolase N-terminal domain-containing protein [Virgibacillus sp. Bac330]
MNILEFTEKVRAIATEGVYYARDPYDDLRYKKLLDLTAEVISSTLNVDKKILMTNFLKDSGIITPKIGVVVPIVSEDGNYLILQRSDDFKWCFPCGFVDVREDIYSTSIKEVKEETGLNITPRGINGLTFKGPDTYDDITHYQLNVVVETNKVKENSKISLSHEHIHYRWIDISENVSDSFWHSGHEKILNYLENNVTSIPLIK